MQLHPHSLFGVTYFGSFENFEEENYDIEMEQENTFNPPWTIILETENVYNFQQKIGLYIRWEDHFY